MQSAEQGHAVGSARDADDDARSTQSQWLERRRQGREEGHMEAVPAGGPKSLAAVMWPRDWLTAEPALVV